MDPEIRSLTEILEMFDRSEELKKRKADEINSLIRMLERYKYHME